MISPDAAPASPETFRGGFDGLPPLARDRLTEDFQHGERYLYLFNPGWLLEDPELIAGSVSDIIAYDRPFRMGLPLGYLYPVLAEEAERLTGKREVTLKSLEARPSDPGLPRQIMMDSPDLRRKMPSPGYVTLETPGAIVPRVIGIDMNDNALIPETALPHLKNNDAFRMAWLLDGSDDLEERGMLERAIHARTVEPRQARKQQPGSRQPGRARRHGLAASGRVGNVTGSSLSLSSTDTFSADRV